MNGLGLFTGIVLIGFAVFQWLWYKDEDEDELVGGPGVYRNVWYIRTLDMVLFGFGLICLLIGLAL